MDYVKTALDLAEQYINEGNHIAASAAANIAAERVSRSQQLATPEEMPTPRHARRNLGSTMKRLAATAMALEGVKNDDPPRSPRMSRSTHQRLEHFYLNLTGMIANTVELRERLQQGRKQKPREQKDALAHHGRHNMRIIRAGMEIVGETPPMGSINRQADQARITKARADSIQLVHDFERWDQRRFPELRPSRCKPHQTSPRAATHKHCQGHPGNTGEPPCGNQNTSFISSTA